MTASSTPRAIAVGSRQPRRAAAGLVRADAESLGRAWLRRTVIFLIWTALAFLSASQGALMLAHAGRPVSWSALLTSSLLDWYTCAAFTPAYIWLVRRFPIDRQHWPLSAAIQFVATSVFVVIKYAVYGPLRAWLIPSQTAMSLEQHLARSFIMESIAFWAVLGVVHAMEFYRRFREREVQALRLQAQLAEARLEALSAQLHPHFLFNTLHGVSTLMHRDVEAADTMLTRLGDLLRHTLRNADRHEVPLSEELDLLANYVAIIGVRFQDRLTVRTLVAPGAEQGLVPHFILQPLVENAVQHGIARRAGAGTIEITAERHGEMLRLRVTDDGAGLGRGVREFPSEGIGLSNTRLRLRELYGGRQRLELESLPSGGFGVMVELPFRGVDADVAPAPS